MGEKNLKDIFLPERIYQLNVPDLPSEFAPLNTYGKIRNNLPTQLTTFIGRENEVEQVKKQLEKSHLVTLIGSGGVGKTRLSLQVATELLDKFPNGIWFVELAPITDPDLIPQIILTAADMQTQQGRSALDSLTDFLREKTSLLVLDNCEHLIEACAKLADMLLNAAPNLKILASSREALGVKGEQASHVPSLSIPDLKHLPAAEGLSQYEAVRLFIDRAVLAQPHFTVTDENANAVAQICSRLDGIPLAIELAAARVKVLKAEQIAERLNDRFRLLTGGSRTALPRQQTLRALIDWSYNLLPDEERTFLRRLSVFMGGWTLEAAEAVCGNADALDLLSHLVDKSLVSVDFEHGEEPRYYLLETVRQYAREKLIESNEGEITREHHLEYFMRLAESNEARRKTSEQMLAYKQMNLELDNFRLALGWSLGEDTNDYLCEKGLLLANFLDWAEISIEEGVIWLKKGLTLISDNNPKFDLTRAKTMTYLGWLFVSMDESQSAIDSLEKSLTIYQSHNPQDKSDWVNTFSNFAYAYLDSDLAKAHDYAQQGLILARSMGEAGYWNLDGALYWVGCVAYRQTEFETAKSNTLEGLAIARQLGDNLSAAGFLQLLGWIEEVQENYDAARTYLSQVQGIYSNNDYSSGIKHVLRDIASLERVAGRYDEARKTLEETLALERDSGSKMGMVDNLWSFGETLIFLSEFEQATKTLRECLQLVHNAGNPSFKGYGLFSLAKVLKHYGRFHEAARLLGAIEVEATKDLWQLYAKRKTDYDQNFEAIKNALGESEFASAYAEGKAMTLDQAVTYALELTI
jgi:predicted ATPase